MSNSHKYFTIPSLARRLGVTPASVREWIGRGLIEEPDLLPVTLERAYPAAAANRIEAWYMKRSAQGGTRGPGASARRERAKAWLSAISTEQQERFGQFNAEPSHESR